MKKLLPLSRSLALFSLGLGVSALHAPSSVLTPQASYRATVSQTIGITDVAVVYHRPSVNKREIWGHLVPYGYNYQNFGTSHESPWRAGANENTTISFQHDVTIAGQPLKAGTYGFSMAVAADGTVTLIFSRDAALWGSFFYDKSLDALRVDVKWEDAPFHELLTYDFTDVTKNSAVLALSWEKKRIPFTVKTDTEANVVATLKDELHNSRGFQYQAWDDGVDYLLANNLDLNLALIPGPRPPRGAAFPGEQNFPHALHQGCGAREARPDQRGRPADGPGAMKFGSATDIHQYGRKLTGTGQSREHALEIFKLNVSLHPDQWPVNYGLARGYSAIGNYPAALEALLKAQPQVPDGDTVNAAAITTNIEKLKRGENIN